MTLKKKNIHSLPKKFKPKKVKPLQVYLFPWKPYQVPVSIDCYTISLPVIINGNNENRMIALNLRRLWGANRTENGGSNLNYYRPKAHRTQKLFKNFKKEPASYSFMNILMSKMSLKSCKSALEVYLEKYLFGDQLTISAQNI